MRGAIKKDKTIFKINDWEVHNLDECAKFGEVTCDQVRGFLNQLPLSEGFTNSASYFFCSTLGANGTVPKHC